MVAHLTGCDPKPTPQAPTEPSRVALPTPKPKPPVPPAPKPEPEPKQPVEPPAPGPKKPPTFTEALAGLGDQADALRKTFDAGLPAKKKLLTAEELDAVERILRRKTTGRDEYTAGDLALLRKHGLGDWVRSSAVKWAAEDKRFATVGKRVWDRSPKLQTPAGLFELAARWGELDTNSRNAVVQAMDRFEQGGNVTSEERDLLREILGTEYFTNAP